MTGPTVAVPSTVEEEGDMLPSEPPGWNEFVDGHVNGHLLQTTEWAALKSQFGWWSRSVVLTSASGEILAGAQVLFRKVAGQVLAYVPKGPVVDWADPDASAQLVDRLVQVARGEGAFVLKVEPELPDTPANRGLLTRAGFQPSQQTIQPRSTVVVDLSSDEKAILARMKSKWRYNIRLAGRKGVVVRELAQAELPLFQELMDETGERDRFFVHNAAYYRRAYELLVPRWGAFFLATFEEEPLASIAVFATGHTAWYLWGASSNRRRNLMPNHALQWAAMSWARARGCTRYDFWGIPDEVGALAAAQQQKGATKVLAEEIPLDLSTLPEGDLWGVFRFKQGFGGTVERTVGAWDMPLNRPKFTLYKGALAARRQAAEVRRTGLALSVDLVDKGTKQVKSLRQRFRSGVKAERQVDVQQVATQTAWEDALARLPAECGHVLQSWPWGTVKAATGWQAERWTVSRDEQLVGGFQFLWRQPLRGVPLRVAYVPKGPVVDWQDEGAVIAVLAQIEALARQRNCLQVKIDPAVAADDATGQWLTSLLAQRNWRFSPEQIQFKNTGFTDISGPEDKLLARFKSKWRYNIRLATRRGITVREAGQADLPSFYELYRETSVRDGFLIRPYAYYETLWRTFLSEQASGTGVTGGALLLAEHAEEEMPVAGLFLLRHGPRTVYFNGASSSRRRRDMPNHLLQWQAIQWARSQGCTVYDWWGAPTDPDDPEDPLQGVWRFKEGFGAQLAVHVGAWDWSPNRLLWHGYHKGMPFLLDLMRRRHRSA